MTLDNSRTRLLNGAAMGLCGALAAVAFSGEAQAQSVCIQASPTTFTCNDPTPNPDQTASGTFTAGSTFIVVPQGVSISNTSALTGTMTGIINTTAPGQQAVFFNSSAGPGGLLTYTSTGTATSTGLGTVTTQLFGTSVNAVTGTNLATGDFSTGVWSRSTGGNNTVTGGTTTVTGVNSFGMSVETFDGTAIVNTGVISATGAGSNGVLSSTGLSSLAICGSNTVNVTGNVAATGFGVIATSSCGAATVAVNSGGVSTPVTGSTTILTQATTTATTVINAGTVTAGAASALVINNNGAQSTTVINGGSVTGRYDGTGGADLFNMNGGTFTTDGTSDFQAGADTFGMNGGIANIGGSTSFTNLETVAIGSSATLNLAAGTFAVPNATAFSSSGIIRAEGGASTITTAATLANSGTIDLQDGVTDDVLTIGGAFAGSGGSNLDIEFTGAATDRLVITGAASGGTAVDAIYLGGGFNPDGLLVVDTGTSTANAFVLGAVTGETPLVDVSLVRIGQDFFLVVVPTDATFNPLVVPGFAIDLWYQSADEIFAETVKPATTEGLSFWGEGYASRDRYGDDDASVTINAFEFDVDNRVKTKRHGIQLGVDYGFGNGRVGLSGGYAWADANGSGGANPRARGWNLGVYGQFGGLTGFHAEFLAKHDRYDAEFEDGAFEGTDFDITSTGVDGAVGYRFGFGGMAMDARAGLSHVRTKIDDISAFGFDYDIGKVTSTRGRAGLRAILGDSGWAPYIDGTVYHEFNGDGEIELFVGLIT